MSLGEFSCGHHSSRFARFLTLVAPTGIQKSRRLTVVLETLSSRQSAKRGPVEKPQGNHQREATGSGNHNFSGLGSMVAGALHVPNAVLVVLMKSTKPGSRKNFSGVVQPMCHRNTREATHMQSGKPPQFLLRGVTHFQLYPGKPQKSCERLDSVHRHTT